MARRGRVALILWEAEGEDLEGLDLSFRSAISLRGSSDAMRWNCGGMLSLGVEKMENVGGVL